MPRDWAIPDLHGAGLAGRLREWYDAEGAIFSVDLEESSGVFWLVVKIVVGMVAGTLLGSTGSGARDSASLFDFRFAGSSHHSCGLRRCL